MSKQKVGIVVGNLPSVEEIDQFASIAEEYDVEVISSESICGYLAEASRFANLRCVALPDHDDNPSYLPGLEQTLNGYDLVIVKERLGLYSYQAVKSKWRNRFRMAVWVDNLATFPGEDVTQMRTVREELDNAADLYIVQSKAAQETLKLEGVAEDRIRFITPFVETRSEASKADKEKALAALQLPSNSQVVAYVGQVEWEEGLTGLVDALKFMEASKSKKLANTKLVICGVGSFGGQFRDEMVKRGLDDAAIYVAPNRDAHDAIWKSADCVFVASQPTRDRVEGDPFRILASMTNKIPVVAPRTALIEEFCGKHRFDFCPDSPSSLATALEKAVTAGSLRNNVVAKNSSTVSKSYTKAKFVKDITAAINELGKSEVSVDSSAIDLQVAEVETKVSMKQYLAAIDLIESIFQHKDLPVHHMANLYRLIGDCFAKLGDNDGAKEAYIKTIELDAFSAKAYIGLGTIGLIKGSHDIAVIHFQKAISLSPDDEMANLGLGLAFQGLEEYEEATRWVGKALDNNPENTAAIYTLVKISYEVDQYEAAEAALRRYSKLHPNDHNMLYTLAGILYKTERWEDVLQLTSEIIAIDPMDTRAHTLAKQARRQLEVPSGSSTSNG